VWERERERKEGRGGRERELSVLYTNAWHDITIQLAEGIIFLISIFTWIALRGKITNPECNSRKLAPTRVQQRSQSSLESF